METKTISSITQQDYMYLIKEALEEDKAQKDITTNSILEIIRERDSRQYIAYIIAKETIILCGTQIVEDVFLYLDNKIHVEILKKDGSLVNNNEKIITIHGSIGTILKAERLALNFLSFLSGISTKTYKIQQKLRKYNIQLLDTRKTIPGYRKLSKYAVYVGNGKNHRFDLEEMGLIKDNHIQTVRNLEDIIRKFRQLYPNKLLQIEIESFEQLSIALKENIDGVLLDNMSSTDLKKCVSIIRKHKHEENKPIFIEASGGYNIDNIAELRDTGIDFVSMSSITMSSRSANFSLEID